MAEGAEREVVTSRPKPANGAAARPPHFVSRRAPWPLLALFLPRWHPFEKAAGAVGAPRAGRTRGEGLGARSLTGPRR